MDPLWAGRFEASLSFRAPSPRGGDTDKRRPARMRLRLGRDLGGVQRGRIGRTVRILRLCVGESGACLELGLLAAPVTLLRGNESITDVPDGPDQRLVLDSELRAQASYVDVDRPRTAEVVVAPDLLEQLRA